MIDQQCRQCYITNGLTVVTGLYQEDMLIRMAVSSNKLLSLTKHHTTKYVAE